MACEIYIRTKYCMFKTALRMCDIRFVKALGGKQIPNWFLRLFDKIKEDTSGCLLQASWVQAKNAVDACVVKLDDKNAKKQKLFVDETSTWTTSRFASNVFFYWIFKLSHHVHLVPIFVVNSLTLLRLWKRTVIFNQIKNDTNNISNIRRTDLTN